jgi:hypothetical protein
MMSNITSVPNISALKDISKDCQYKAVLVLSTGGTYYLKDGDTNSADDSWAIIVANDGGRWYKLQGILQSTTNPWDYSSNKIFRNATHSGGAPGFVSSALRVDHYVSKDVTNFEWGITSVLHNSATAGENVSVYAQANKVTSTAGPTWAAVIEAHDRSGTPNAPNALVGLELDVFANGGDAYSSRIGLDIVGGVGTGSTLPATIFAGIRISPQLNDKSKCSFTNTILVNNAHFVNAINLSNVSGTFGIIMSGSLAVGFDTSNTSISTAAIRIGAGQKIAFDGSSNMTLQESGDSLVFNGGRVVMNKGWGLSSTGNVSTTASSGYSGSLPSQVAGYVIIKIDNVNYKIPYYGN